jgi:hypothetical protein
MAVAAPLRHFQVAGHAVKRRSPSGEFQASGKFAWFQVEESAINSL